jgi:hypothetical protein
MCGSYLDELRKIRQEQKDYEKKRKLLEATKKRAAKDIGPKIGKVVKRFGKILELRYSIGKEGSSLNVGYENNIAIFVDIDEDFHVYIKIISEHYRSEIYLEEFSEDKLAKEILKAYKRRYRGSL